MTAPSTPTGPFVVTVRQSTVVIVEEDETARVVPATGPHEGHPTAKTRVVYREAFATLEDHSDLEFNDGQRAVLRASGFEPWGNHGWVRFEEYPDGVEQGGTCYDDCWALRVALADVLDAGPTVLPNGDVIEVEKIGMLKRSQFALEALLWTRATDKQWCAAWNAEHGIGIERRADAAR